jgi:hypothetical protein
MVLHVRLRRSHHTHANNHVLSADFSLAHFWVLARWHFSEMATARPPRRHGRRKSPPPLPPSHRGPSSHPSLPPLFSSHRARRRVSSRRVSSLEELQASGEILRFRTWPLSSPPSATTQRAAGVDPPSSPPASTHRACRPRRPTGFSAPLHLPPPIANPSRDSVRLLDDPRTGPPWRLQPRRARPPPLICILPRSRTPRVSSRC